MFIDYKPLLDQGSLFEKPRKAKIVTLSGGKASAWCADWAFKHYEKKDVILYFNDTKWEHEDLYRFLDDLSNHFDHPITRDSDGRTPEQLFYDNNYLANNLAPFCSRILKAVEMVDDEPEMKECIGICSMEA